MNIPKITFETQLPFQLWLNGEGAPLEGLKDGAHGKGYHIYVDENDRGENDRPVKYFYVITTGHTLQTKRKNEFYSRQQMIDYVNDWIQRTVERGLELLEKQRLEKSHLAIARHNHWLSILKNAGGLEEYKAFRMQQVSDDAIYAAINSDKDAVIALWNNTLTDEQRNRLVAFQSQYIEARKDMLEREFDAIEAAIRYTQGAA